MLPQTCLHLLTNPGSGSLAGASDLLEGCSFLDSIIRCTREELRSAASLARVISQVRATKAEYALFLRILARSSVSSHAFSQSGEHPTMFWLQNRVAAGVGTTGREAH